MWISRKKWSLLQTDVMATRGEIEEICKLLGIPFYNRISKMQEEPKASELYVAAILLKQAEKLIEEVIPQEKNL